MFREHDKVFYPHHGAGIIQGVQEKEFQGEKRVYYIIRFPLTETTIMVPVDNTEELGLRTIADPKEIKRCFDLIINTPTDTDEDWKVRYKKHQDMLKSGTTREVSLVIKNLYQRNKIKELSTTEKKLYNNAIKMLISEIALSINKNQDDVKIELFRILDSQTA